MRRPGRALTAVAATALAAGCSAAATADATSAAPAVTQAKVTGYKSGGPAFPSSGPVTVVLRGKTAAHLDQVLNGLPKGGSMECMENVLLYNVTFALPASRKTIDVAGYTCVAAVQVTEDGKTTLRTDHHCALLEAVRKVLPASAVTTQQDPAACNRLPSRPSVLPSPQADQAMTMEAKQVPFLGQPEPGNLSRNVRGKGVAPQDRVCFSGGHGRI